MPRDRMEWSRINGFAIEAKLLGVSPMAEQPEYLKYAQAIERAFPLKSRGDFHIFMEIYLPGWTIKYHPALDWYHGVDAVLVSPEGVLVTIDISTYRKPGDKLKADVNIVHGTPEAAWKQEILAVVSKKSSPQKEDNSKKEGEKKKVKVIIKGGRHSS